MNIQRPGWPTVALALAYIAASLLGGFLALPPGYASPMWPAAGVGVGSLLIFGWRHWPGIWLGSFVFNAWLAGSGDRFALAAIVATGASLQAVVAVRLVAPVFATSPPLADDKAVARFLFRAGPVASLISATIAISGLNLVGLLPLSEAAAPWTAWWSGDTLGVLLFAPIMLVAGPLRGKAVSMGLGVVVPLLVAAGMLASARTLFDEHEALTGNDAEARLMNEVYSTHFVAVPALFQGIDQLDAYFAASEQVEADEFQTFTEHMLRKRALVGLVWAPRVRGPERTEFEATGQAMFAFTPTGLGPLRHVQRDYFPIVYAEPATRMSAMRGADLSSEVSRQAALLKSAGSGEAQLTGRVTLHPSMRPGVVLFQAVYRAGFSAIGATAPERLEALQGVVAGLFDLGAALAEFRAAADEAGLSYRLTDITPGSPEQSLADTVPPGAKPNWSQRFEIAGRTWNLEMASVATPWAAGQSTEARWLAIGSTICAFLVAFAALGTAGRAARTHAEVERRTAELNVELAARQAAETALREKDTGLERMVEQLEGARIDAEQASRAKSAFLATMSHEIRTPMNGILGMLDVVNTHGLTADQTEVIDTVRQSAFALLRVVDDILDFSKIEAGRMELERAPVALADLAESACSALATVAAARGVDLTLFVSPDLPSHVLSDSTRLRQVLNNLVGNAIKFSGGRPDHRGRVDVRIEPAETPAGDLAIIVADDGIGMSSETLGKLFSAFQQAETSTTRRFGGTGLGLVICRRLVELMGGSIDVESAEEVGSRFTVRLPMEPAVGPASPAVDVSGIDVIVGPCTTRRADDVAAYLANAGARVHPTGDNGMIARIASDLDAPVVIHDGGARTVDEALAVTKGVGGPAARHVIVLRGGHRGVRVHEGVVIVDGDVLRRAALRRAVGVAAGRASPETVHDLANAIPEGLAASVETVAEARAAGRLILVAEDDEVNRRVIVRQLLALGYTAELARDGAEALAMWRQGGHALVLSDLHMPQLDGYALAASIRAEERDGAHVPILALTANAVRGEETRALAAGMQAYLTKPIPLPLLRAALTRWLGSPPHEAPSDARASRSTPGATVSVFDLDTLRSLIGSDDEETVQAILGEFAAACERMSAEMRRAMASGDIRALGATAHKLKSASRATGARVLADACAELEAACAGRPSEALGLTGHVDAALVEVAAAVRSHRPSLFTFTPASAP